MAPAHLVPIQPPSVCIFLRLLQESLTIHRHSPALPQLTRISNPWCRLPSMVGTTKEKIQQNHNDWICCCFLLLVAVPTAMATSAFTCDLWKSCLASLRILGISQKKPNECHDTDSACRPLGHKVWRRQKGKKLAKLLNLLFHLEDRFSNFQILVTKPIRSPHAKKQLWVFQEWQSICSLRSGSTNLKKFQTCPEKTWTFDPTDQA